MGRTGEEVRDETFPALLLRVRATIRLRLGANASKDFMLVLDLMELLYHDKADRVSRVDPEA